jgi:hypothetical protein
LRNRRGLDQQRQPEQASVTHPSHITYIVAGSADSVLALVVGGTVTVALLVNVLALVGWLRGR